MCAWALMARSGSRPTIRRGAFCALRRRGDGISQTGVAARSSTRAATRIALAELLDPLFDIGLRQPVKDMLGWNFSGLAQIRDRKLGLALRLIDAGTRRISVNLADAFQCNGFVEIGERAAVLALLRPRHAPPNERIRFIGLDLQRVIEVGDRPIRLALRQQGLAAKRPADDVVLVERNRPTK